MGKKMFLYKLNGQQFSYTNLTKCVGVSDLYWTRSAYRTVRIVTSGKNIKVYVDGTLYINYTDTSPIESGSYGFFSLSQADSRFASITGKATLAHYIATFNANGGTLSGSSSKTVTSTKTYGTLPTATRTGYTFAGWYDAKTGGNKITSTSTVDIAADTIFYARWTPIDYTISYNLNGGTASNKTSYNIETATFTLNSPTKAGYTFTGWTGSNGTAPQKSVSVSKGSTGNKAYTAVFEKNVYTITTSENGSGVLSNSSKVEYADSTSVFIVPADGYTTSSLKIDGVSITPVTKYNFLNVKVDHKVEVMFTMTQTRKMSLFASIYDWIDLKLK
jgi:uncharacterized repeat protein (TIGR02543 family)